MPNSLSTHMATSQMTGHVRLAMMRVRVSASNPDPLASSFLSRRNAFATCMQQLWMPGKLFSTNLQCSVSVPNATTSFVGHASPEGCIAMLGNLVQWALHFKEQKHDRISCDTKVVCPNGSARVASSFRGLHGKISLTQRVHKDDGAIVIFSDSIRDIGNI